MKTFLRNIVAALALSWASAALAQSTPNLIFGQIPTVGQWNSYFAAKQDTLGYVAVNKAGDVLTGELIMAPSTLSLATMNIPVGVAPTTPQNGDLWATASGLFMRVGGVTVGPFGISSPVAQVINLNSAPLHAAQAGTILQMGQANGVIARAELDSFANTGAFTCVRADGTGASPTTLQSGDEICSLNGWGYNGAAFVGGAARISIFAAQNWSVGAQGSRIVTSTTLNATNTLVDRLTIENDGGVLVPPTVTGGDKGAGTLNASGLFINGAPGLASASVSLSGNILTVGINGTITGAVDFATGGGSGASVRVQNLSTTSPWNFNLPTTAGSAGQPLISGGGVGAVQTYGTLGLAGGGIGLTSGTSGGLLCFTGSTTLASSTALGSNNVVVGGGGGACPVTNNLFTFASGVMSAGVNGTTGGAVDIANGTVGGGSVRIQNLGTTAGNAYNFNLPSTVGTAGQPLLSQGGGATSQTYGTLGFIGGGTGSTSYTTGSIPFSNGTVLTQDNANLFWDNTAKLLSVGTNSFSVVNGEHAIISGSASGAHIAERIVNNNTAGFSTLWLGPNNEGFIRFGATGGNKMSIVASVAGVPVTIATQGTDRVTVSDTGVVMTGWLQIGKTTVAGLPTCNAGQEATLFFVTDQNTAVAYRGAVTGGGTTHQLVLCSNSAWIQD